MKDTEKQLHGSIPYEQLRKENISIAGLIDFSATVNPYPFPEQITSKLTQIDISHYPDPQSYEAVQALAALHQIPSDWICVTAGLTEPIFYLPWLYKTAVCFSPTYGDYRAAFTRWKRHFIEFCYPGDESEFAEILAKLHKTHFNLLIICNPNNPDGNVLSNDQIQQLCLQFPQATICIDESYQEMSRTCDSALILTDSFRNLLVLKSLTKPFGIGGIRAAYLVCSGPALQEIRQMQTPWSVSVIAQNIIPLFVEQYPLFRRQWNAIWHQKQQLLKAFKQLGISTTTSPCPFFLAKVKDASGLRIKLLREHRIAIRDCSSFGLPEWIRIMPSVEPKNIRLIEALREYCTPQ